MKFPEYFIGAGADYSSLDHFVAAPYLRKEFELKTTPKFAQMLVTALGFYELYINGKRITKGALAPYISNPDHIVYYDNYDISKLLTAGKNVVGLCLGNGFQNNPGGYIWDFQKASFRGAPRTAMQIEVEFEDNTSSVIDSESGFKTAPSPIYFDDYRAGEYYDARNEIDGWNLPGFDDASWVSAQKAESPRGEKRLCTAPPIVETRNISPVAITDLGDGYLYDFSGNYVGVTRLCINAEAGQKITLHHGEILENGRLDMSTVACDRTTDSQKDIYVCSGNACEIWQPLFVYHGFRYVFVEGLTKEQAVRETLTCVTMNSDLHERGSFSCSDEVINKLQDMTRESDLGNFYYFPTDCPHREKNGWTGDAALSIEHMLLNLDVETSFREWMRNVCKAQADDGELPGIVPTGGWGFNNGPAWDCVMTYVPYFIYMYRGDKAILEESASGIWRYLHYLNTRIQDDGLVYWGLGDWCQTARDANNHDSPTRFTDSIVAMDICKKACEIFTVLNMPLEAEFAQKLFSKFRIAIRTHLLDFDTMLAEGNCQTSQAMAIFYGAFEPAEAALAFQKLVDMIHKADDHFDVGVLGARVIFHVLSAHGECDLALKLITQETFPSYAWWAEQGSNTLWEDFHLICDNPKPGCEIHSRNHHFWGDISHFFIRHLAGINYNPNLTGNEVHIKPIFATKLDFATAYYDSPQGKISSSWKRVGNIIELSVTVPSSIHGKISLPFPCQFDSKIAVIPLESGTYIVNC